MKVGICCTMVSFKSNAPCVKAPSRGIRPILWQAEVKQDCLSICLHNFVPHHFYISRSLILHVHHVQGRVTRVCWRWRQRRRAGDRATSTSSSTRRRHSWQTWPLCWRYMVQPFFSCPVFVTVFKCCKLSLVCILDTGKQNVELVW